MRFGVLVAVLASAACDSSGAEKLTRELAASRQAVKDLRKQVHALEVQVQRTTNVDECAPLAQVPSDARVTANGSVTITTFPPGASVYSGSKDYGQTPVAIHMDQPTMDIRIQKSGYVTLEKTVSAERTYSFIMRRRR